MIVVWFVHAFVLDIVFNDCVWFVYDLCMRVFMTCVWFCVRLAYDVLYACCLICQWIVHGFVRLVHDVCMSCV